MAKKNRARITRITIAALLIIIASLTVGRDIYYGSRDEGLLSFAVINTCGYLFFIFIPVEIAFVYYLNSQISVLALCAVAIGTALFSQALDYTIGLLISNKFIDNLIGRSKYEKAQAKLLKYGSLTIFAFNALPLSSPVISLAAGMLRFRVRDTLISTVLGLIAKYALLTIFF